MSILVVVRAGVHPGEERWRAAVRELILDWGRRWAEARGGVVGKDWHPSIRVTKNTGGEFVAGRYTKTGSLDAKLAAVEEVDWFMVSVSGATSYGLGVSVSALLNERKFDAAVSLVLRDSAFPPFEVTPEVSDAAFDILGAMAAAVGPCGAHAWCWGSDASTGPYAHGGALGLAGKDLYSGAWVPGYDWMLAITGAALEKLGGVTEVVANAPVETRVPESAHGDVVACRVAVDPATISEDHYRAWRNYLALVLPPHIGPTRARKPAMLLDEDWHPDSGMGR